MVQHPHNNENESSKDVLFDDNEDNMITSSNCDGYSEEYSKIKEFYTSLAKKEQSSQIIGSVFSFSLLFIDILFIYFLSRVIRIDIRSKLILRVSIVFLLLFIIALFVLYQLHIVRKWNKSIKASQSRSRYQTLTENHLDFVQKIEKIRKIILIVIILCIVTLIVYFNTNIIVDIQSLPPNKTRIYRILVIFRTTTFITLIIFCIFEIIQFFHWNSKIKQYLLFLLKIQKEVPNLSELDALMENED